MKEKTSLIKKDNWYRELLTDLKVFAWNKTIEIKHAIGKRILQDEKKFGEREYGSKRIENLAKDLQGSSQELYRCIQFAKKYPELSHAVRELSWHHIANNLLPEPREKIETPELPKGKYQVIYMDLPWEYDVDLSSGATRSPENNYPVMDLDAIKEFGGKVREIAHKNCVLFMWITAPKLNWMNEVLESFGFTYRTNLIWDKIKPNMGHYSSVRHEILVIAGKGTCSPTCDGKTIQSVDSVQSIEKSSKHSEKPQEFYGIIEKLYPNAKKIELFHRGIKRKGWEQWGIESGV